jgi:hypothetical protein
MIQIPNPNGQIPNKFQSLNLKFLLEADAWFILPIFDFEIYLEFGIWILGFLLSGAR